MTSETMTAETRTSKATTFKTVLASILATMLLAVSAFAQGPSKPGPELQKLDYFTGSWTTDATIAPGPWGNGGKLTSSNTNEWMPGGYFVVTHRDYKMPAGLGGDGSAIQLLGYDASQHVYTADEFNSQGRHIISKGTLTGDTWVWNSSANYGGMDIQQKMTLKTISPTKYSMKFETSTDGTNWMTFMEGTINKK